MTNDPLNVTATLEVDSGTASYVSLAKLGARAGADPARLPHTVKILLENIARRAGGRDVSEADVTALARWPKGGAASIAFMPARVLMQDFTGVPAVVDLAALAQRGRPVGRQTPGASIPSFPSTSSSTIRSRSIDSAAPTRMPPTWSGNIAAIASVTPCSTGRSRRSKVSAWCHRAWGSATRSTSSISGRSSSSREGWLFPDTLVGTDSHTPMINGLGVLGWGVGGIEAEAAMLGQPMFLPKPVVLGVRTRGALPAGTTATDLVLMLTQMLRAHGVVGKFVEFFGPGLSALGIADRATLANMSPEFGATSTLFPVDANTVRYLKLTGRGALVDRVERYTREQGLFRTERTPSPSSVRCSISISERSSRASPDPSGRRTACRLRGVRQSFKAAFDGVERPVDGQGHSPARRAKGAHRRARSSKPRRSSIGNPRAAASVTDGSVVIAAITSCTNTSNPSVMIAAGLLARKAVEAGLQCRPWVKTSLAPGSRVVTQYLDKAGLTPYLEKLGFNLVGYGCTTCIGNSGPLPAEIADVVTSKDLAVVAVLSGNRNFEGRIHGQVKASYLASPPLCVAYALAGTVKCDLTVDPLGSGRDGKPVYLKDIWPTRGRDRILVASSVSSDQFDLEYGRIFEGDEKWKSMPAPTGTLFDWDGRLDLRARAALFHGVRERAGAARRHRRGTGAGAVRRFDHDRSHLTRRSHHGRFTCGRVSGRRMPCRRRNSIVSDRGAATTKS